MPRQVNSVTMFKRNYGPAWYTRYARNTLSRLTGLSLDEIETLNRLVDHYTDYCRASTFLAWCGSDYTIEYNKDVRMPRKSLELVKRLVLTFLPAYTNPPLSIVGASNTDEARAFIINALKRIVSAIGEPVDGVETGNGVALVPAGSNGMLISDADEPTFMYLTRDEGSNGRKLFVYEIYVLDGDKWKRVSVRGDPWSAKNTPGKTYKARRRKPATLLGVPIDQVQSTLEGLELEWED